LEISYFKGQEIGCEDETWMNLTQECVQSLVLAILNLQVLLLGLERYEPLETCYMNHKIYGYIYLSQDSVYKWMQNFKSFWFQTACIHHCRHTLLTPTSSQTTQSADILVIVHIKYMSLFYKFDKYNLPLSSCIQTTTSVVLYFPST